MTIQTTVFITAATPCYSLLPEMNATLYLPKSSPLKVSSEGLTTLGALGFARVPEQVPELLGCSPELVDILASGASYVAYSVFDSEGEANHQGMAAVAKASGITFDKMDEDTTVRGAILLVLAS